MRRWVFILIGSMTTLSSSEEEASVASYSKPSLSGFSQSARFETRDPWGFSISAAFNEYMAMQDSMEIGYEGNVTNDFFPANGVPEGKVVSLGFNYHPGFQVGLVINTPSDDWNFNGNYLWFHGHSHIQKQALSPTYYVSPVFNIDSFEVPLNSLDANWNLGIQLVDFCLSRPYYSGRRLTVEPTFGLRGDLIRQNFDLSATLLNGSWTSQTASTKSKSWGIGPRLGGQSNYILGKGFSLFGNMFTSVLYTRYTTVSLNYANSINQTSFMRNGNYGAIRPIIDAGLGLNWKAYFGLGSGTYHWHKTFYVNIQAAYNLLMFFAQNMERTLVSFSSDSQTVPGNLYLQGLSVGVSVVF